MGIGFNHNYLKLMVTYFVISDIIANIECNDVQRNYRNGRRLTREMKVDSIIKDIRVGKKIFYEIVKNWSANNKIIIVLNSNMKLLNNI